MKNELPIIENRKCEMCGCEFGITALQKKKRYCKKCAEISYSRYIKAYRKSNKQKQAVKKWYKKNHKEESHYNICTLCGEQFLTKQGKAKYCISCVEAKAETETYFRRILERRTV